MRLYFVNLYGLMFVFVFVCDVSVPKKFYLYTFIINKQLLTKLLILIQILVPMYKIR